MRKEREGKGSAADFKFPFLSNRVRVGPTDPVSDLGSSGWSPGRAVVLDVDLARRVPTSGYSDVGIQRAHSGVVYGAGSMWLCSVSRFRTGNLKFLLVPRTMLMMMPVLSGRPAVQVTPEAGSDQPITAPVTAHGRPPVGLTRRNCGPRVYTGTEVSQCHWHSLRPAGTMSRSLST